MTPQPGHFEYLMLRLGRSEQGGEPIAGLAELIRTGEKRGFESGEQLLRLINEWSQWRDGSGVRGARSRE